MRSVSTFLDEGTPKCAMIAAPVIGFRYIWSMIRPCPYVMASASAVPRIVLSLFSGLVASTFWTGVALGQPSGTFVGHVTDAESGLPLPGVNVLVSSTTLGASTDADGRFVVGNVPIGPWSIAASMVGYVTQTRDAAIWNAHDTVRVSFRLAPSVYDLGEVEVTAERTTGWQRDFRLFRRLFLGESDNARATVIQNPYVLDFRRTDQTFYASASAPLVIENQALGYRLRYVLRSFRWRRNPDHLSFQGEPYFEELEPRDEAEAVKWATNRGATFRGSRQHFLWALARDRVADEGFRMERGALDQRPGEVLPVRGAGLVSSDQIKGGKSQEYDFILHFEGHIIVSYEIPRPIYLFGFIPLPNTELERSVMRMDAREAMIHQMGYFLGPPGSLVFAGHWGQERIADLLPLDYVRIWEEHAAEARTTRRTR